MKVGEGEHVVALVETRGGDRAAGDLAEEAVGISSHERMLNRGSYFREHAVTS